ncbi:MAG: isochorismate synthase MenF [Elainellaceae cyanobacterium]
MIVAYRPSSTPTKTDIIEAIYAAVREQQSQSRSPECNPEQALTSKTETGPLAGSRAQFISLSLPLAPVDLLAVWSDLQTDGHGFYCENPAGVEGIAASGCLVQWTGSGSDRFAQAQQVAERWFRQIHSVGLAAQSASRILCQFSFLDCPSASGGPEDFGAAVPAATLFLPRWQVTQQGNVWRFTANFRLPEVDQIAGLDTICATIWKRYTHLRYMAALPQMEIPPLRSQVKPTLLPLSPLRRQQFLAGATALLQAINHRQLTKAVLASALDLPIDAPFSVAMALRRLRHSHSGCHIFATRCGEQTFLGASPERLFRVRQQQLWADAIAGSAPRGMTASADRRLGEALRRSSKERHEHRIVADFILGQLRQLGLRPSCSSQPNLLRLANIQHLYTAISAPIPAHVHPLQIVAKLHPTPAVAGLPQQAACRAIARHELFERSRYAGPLGWIGDGGDSEFIVAIRSALVDKDRMRLYAGAGIVQGSIPAKEWQEVTTKLQAIAAVLPLP